MNLPLFLVPILAALVAQALKPLFSKDHRGEQARTIDPRPRYGGMPSAHAAFTSALVLAVAVAEGVGSAAFAIAAVILILVLDDALRLRIFLGRYGLAIRRLLNRCRLLVETFPPSNGAWGIRFRRSSAASSLECSAPSSSSPLTPASNAVHWPREDLLRLPQAPTEKILSP